MSKENYLYKGNVQIYLQGENALLPVASKTRGDQVAYFIGSKKSKLLIRDFRREPIHAAHHARSGVEGTEFLIELEQDQAKVVMYEGKLSASNSRGSIILTDNEAAIAVREQAPRKEAVVRPIDAVQWALFYPTIISFRLDETAGDRPAARSLRIAIDLYEQGKIVEALAALEPDALVLAADTVVAAPPDR